MEADGRTSKRQEHLESSSGRQPHQNKDPTHTEGDDRRKTLRSPPMGDVESIITSDGLAAIRKKFHLPNEVLIIAPKRSERARAPPPGFITVYEMTLRAGLRFPPAPELLEIFKACDVVLPQFMCRAVTIIVGLTVFFRERGAILNVEYLSKMCKFTSNSQGRVSCRSNKKWLDFTTRDPSKNWASSFFFVKNEWGLPEKWGRLKELPPSLHVGEEDILRILNFQDTETLQDELRYISRYVVEEKLFKVGLSIQAGRSHALPLKKSAKAPEVNPSAFKSSSKIPPKCQKEDGSSSLKKRKMTDVVILPKDGEKRKEVVHPSIAEIVSPYSDNVIRPLKFSVPEELLKHVCTGRHRANEIIIQKMNLETQLESELDDWNAEFVKVKYLHGEYKRRLTASTKEVSELEGQLAECRAELATISTSFSFQTREADLSRHELIEARAEVNQRDEALKILAVEKNALQIDKEILEKEIKTLQDRLLEKESIISDTEGTSSKIIEEFKKSSDYRQEIQKCIKEAYKKIFDDEVRDMERQSLEEGFTRGFLKGVRLVQRKTGVVVDGLTSSQASDDSASNSDGDDIESELNKVFSTDDDDIEII